MMKRLVTYTMMVAVFCAGLSSSVTFADTTTSTTSSGSCSNDKSILLFPAWFHGLKCDITHTTTRDSNDKVISQGTTETAKLDNINDIWIIVMNIVQWLIIAGGYVSLYFIIWSGFKYITAAGDPQKVTAAKNTITNAVIGLIIVLASVAIVRTIQAGIGGIIT